MTQRNYDITQEFIAACNLLDVDPDRVLQRGGLPSLSGGERSLSLTPRQIALIFEAIVTEYGQDDFHIKLANGFAQGAFGHAFLALQCSATLRDGIHRAARFKELLEPVQWAITESRGALRVTLRSQTPDFPFGGVSQIMSFLWLVQSCRNITARSISPMRICITDAVAHQAEIERLMCCPITLSSEACLEFPAAAMDTPILSASRYVVSGLDAGAVNACRAKNADSSLVTAVHSAVLELLPSGTVTAERVARRLALSKRTMERRLSDCGRSFAGIVRDCRMQMADHYLRQTRLPITEIGFLVGYREINSFYRAFRVWHGQTPQAIRDGGPAI